MKFTVRKIEPPQVSNDFIEWSHRGDAVQWRCNKAITINLRCKDLKTHEMRNLVTRREITLIGGESA